VLLGSSRKHVGKIDIYILAALRKWIQKRRIFFCIFLNI
jgi:hypothetical protein